jgi:hypothetical protein
MYAQIVHWLCWHGRTGRKQSHIPDYPPVNLNLFVICLLIAVACGARSADAKHPRDGDGSVEISGELKQWHRVTLTLDGPFARESDTNPNPFTDYRMTVTFRHESGSPGYSVPGYFAADGNAANSSAHSGNKWRAHLSPDKPGRWTYRVSMAAGDNVAIEADTDGRPLAKYNGKSGQFQVRPTDKTSPDFRGKGRLQYVGRHYLRFAGSGEYYLKGGADSPENFLAYDEIDGTYDADAGSGSYSHVGGFIHEYKPHLRDWRPGDPTWKDGKGKGIIGALNYLADKGANSVYFLTYNLDGGDGRDTWMWSSAKERERFDCSKLDQWEIIFDHMDRLGIMLHVVTQETENDRKLGGSPGLNPIRKLYHRELAARFSHHLAVIWNLGEENNTPDADRIEIAGYIRSLDPYDHLITVHTKSNKAMVFYDGILGDPSFEATSIQGDMGNYNSDAFILRQRSARAGRRWVIFGDEQQPARVGVVPDANDPTHDLPRKQALWGNLMGGGSGVEWYFGSRFPHMDINCEDWRTRDRMWDQTRYALEFFQEYLPFWEMEPDNGLAFTYGALVLAKPGRIYAVYLPQGGSARLDLGGSASAYRVRWYNPRSGGELLKGSVSEVRGPSTVSLGLPPGEVDQDWVVLVKSRARATGNANRRVVKISRDDDLPFSVSGMKSIVASGDNGDLISLDGIKVSNLVLGVSTSDATKMVEDHPVPDADNFSLAVYASLDGGTYAQTLFAVPVTKVFLLERGGNDTTAIEVLDAKGEPISSPALFEKSDWFASRYETSGQTTCGIAITSTVPIHGIRVLNAIETMSVDPVSISGVPAK